MSIESVQRSAFSLPVESTEKQNNFPVQRKQSHVSSLELHNLHFTLLNYVDQFLGRFLTLVLKVMIFVQKRIFSDLNQSLAEYGQLKKEVEDFFEFLTSLKPTISAADVKNKFCSLSSKVQEKIKGYLGQIASNIVEESSTEPTQRKNLFSLMEATRLYKHELLCKEHSC